MAPCFVLDNMSKEKTITIIKECTAVLIALALTLIISHTLLSPSSPAVNTSFIAQVGNKVQTFIADAVRSINGVQTHTTTEQVLGPVPRPHVIISQDQEKKVISITFPKEFAYELENGVYR